MYTRDFNFSNFSSRMAQNVLSTMPEAIFHSSKCYANSNSSIRTAKIRESMYETAQKSLLNSSATWIVSAQRERKQDQIVTNLEELKVGAGLVVRA